MYIDQTTSKGRESNRILTWKTRGQVMEHVVQVR